MKTYSSSVHDGGQLKIRNTFNIGNPFFHDLPFKSYIVALTPTDQHKFSLFSTKYQSEETEEDYFIEVDSMVDLKA